MPSPDPPKLDSRALAEVMRRFADALRAHRDELNSLNVYPVPDGDTGTNMLLTQEAVVRALDELGEAGPPQTGEAIARASLMGARGNSGVILSQVLHGLVAVLCAGDPGPNEGARLADALAEAAREAHAAVARPQAGTILTVLGAAAAAAREAVESGESGGGVPQVAEAAFDAASGALARTPELLPELARAGVVDAGGRGALLLFDALSSVVGGSPSRVEPGPFGPVGAAAGGALAAGPPEMRYEVMYLLDAPDDAVAGLRERLDELGDSVVVVGGGGRFNVHVHTNEADAAVAAGRDVGSAHDVRVTDLAEAVGELCLAGQARAVRVADQRVALVAVAEGAGLTELFRSLGAVVVAGGPGHNPSVEELHAAIEATGSASVVVLPNHKNVVPAAERAAHAASRQTRVVPARSVPQGLAAATACNPLGDLDEVAEEMADAARECAAAELAVAHRDAETPAGSVRAGQWLGLAAGELRRVGDDPAALAADLVRELRSPAHEVLTLILGKDAGAEEAERVRGALAAAADGLEIEVHRGDQPRYPYLIGIE